MSSILATDTTAAKITGVTYTPPGGSPQDHIDLQVKSYDITLDKARSPYVDGTLVVTTPEVGAVALMDPTSLTLRCYVTLSKTGVSPALSTKTRNFDLVVRSVKNDAASGETTISLSSDEALLVIDMYAASAVDTTYQANQASLRAIITAALATYGFTLNASPSIDADYTITANLTNQVWNGSFEPNITAQRDGTAVAAGCTASQVSATIGSGTKALQLVATGTADSYYKMGTEDLTGATFQLGMVAGQQITVSGTCKVVTALTGTAAPNGRRLTLTLFYFTTVGGAASELHTTAATNTSGTTTRVTGTFTVPSNATGAFLRVYLGSTAGTAQWDDILVVQSAAVPAGVDITTYFDGTYGDTTHYSLAWVGATNGSVSTRTRLDSRDPKVLDRQPGSAMWDWLSGLVQTPGYRLFCDELRVWRLVDNTYTVSGTVALTQAINLTQGADTIDIGQADTDGQGYVQKVQVVYQWIDRLTAANMTAYDFAGSGHGPGIKILINTPFPGAGLAAAVLARMQGRAHVLDLRALSDLTITPGMGVVASLPSLNESGLVSSVTWTDRDEMTVGTEGLITIPANAWVLALGAWSAATGTWAGATGTN